MGLTLSKRQRADVAARIAAGQRWLDYRQQLRDNDAGKFRTRSDRNVALVAGRYWRKIKPGQDIYSVNHLLTALLVKQAIVASGQSVFIATARRQEFEELVPTAEGVLNDLWDGADLDRQCDGAHWDSMVHPTGGVVELGWTYRDGNIEQTGTRPDELDIAEADTNGVNDAGAVSLPPEVLAAGVEAGIPPVPQELLQESADNARWDNEPEVDEPFVERFDPRCLIIDPACTFWDLSNARYVWRRKWTLLSKVKANTAYSGTRDLKGTCYTTDPTERESIDPADVTTDDVRYVELYDGYTYLKRDGAETLMHVVWSKEAERELLAEPCAYEFSNANPYPFEMMPAFGPDSDSIDMLPDVEKARDLQVTHDLSFTQLEWARAHTPNVLLVPTGTFEGDEGERTKTRIESGHENAILEVDSAFIGAIKWMDRPQRHEDAREALATVPQRILDIIGISEYQANQLPAKEMTKGEVDTLASQGATRQDAEIERYYSFVERVAYKVLTLMQQFQVRDRPFATTTPAGEQQWGTAAMSSLRGGQPSSMMGELHQPGIQFRLKLDASRRRPKNQQQEEQTAAGLVNALAPFAQQPDPRLPNRPMVNMPGVLRRMLQKAKIEDVDTLVPPDPTPEQLQQFQLEQMQQEQMQADRMQMQQEQQAQQEQGKTAAEGQKADADRQAKLMIAQMQAQNRGGAQ